MGSKAKSRSGRPRALHHFRPELHLRHFANAERLVCVYDKVGKVRPGQYPIRTTAVEKRLYTPDGADVVESNPDVMEVWLADRVDGPAAGPLGKVCCNQSLSRQERSSLAAFIAAQDLRTPKARDLVMTSLRAEMETWYGGLAKDIPSLRASIEARSGVACDEQLLRYYLASHEIQIPKTQWLNFISRNLNRAAARIYRMPWQLLRAPSGHEFFTNDVGIVKFGQSFQRPVSFEMGFVDGRDRWLFPLSSRFALALGNSRSPRPIPVAPAWLDEVNRQVIRDAYRFVYSLTYDASITKGFQLGATPV